MRRSRKLALGAVVVGFTLCLFMSGCCLTNRLWQVVADEPQALVDASLTREHVLHLAVRYEDGRTWHLEAPLRPDGAWLRTTARRVGVLDGPLPATAFPIGASEGEVDLDYFPARDKRGNRDHDVWVDGAGCLAIVSLPEPLHGAQAGAWLAAIATPVTLLVDVATAPVWMLWVVMTAGGHGDCWLPWCD